MIYHVAVVYDINATLIRVLLTSISCFCYVSDAMICHVVVVYDINATLIRLHQMYM